MNRLLKYIVTICSILLFCASAVFCEIPILPDPVIVEQTGFDLYESQNYPSLSADENGLILHYQIDNLIHTNIKSLKLLIEPQFTSISEYYLLDSTFIPYYPVYKKIDNRNILYWYEKKYDSNYNDTLYQQQVITYNNNVPGIVDFMHQISLNYNEDSFDYPPQFMKANNRLYCEILGQKLLSPSNNTWELSLRSIDWDTSELYPTNLHFSSNGKTAFTAHGDSLVLLKSWVICTDYENLSCAQWATGYKAYIIYNNKITNIYALQSFDVTNEQNKPTDIEKAIFDGQDIFALKQSKQLVRINYESMRFELIADVSAFVTDEYRRFIPIQTPDYNLIIIENNDISQSQLLRFEHDWSFVDSTTLPFEGEVQELSDFVYYSEKDILVYAYSSRLFKNDLTDRIMLQAVLFDKNIFPNPQEELPDKFTLSQNYPNPFNPLTTIEYSIPSNGQVTVDVFNIRGQRVTTLADNYIEAGNHIVNWDASNVSSGIYLIKVSFDNQSKSIKSILLK